MDRRSLLKTAVGAAASWVAFGASRCSAASPANEDRARDAARAAPLKRATASVTRDGKLAGLTLDGVRQQYRYDLFDDFLPFMDKYVIDHELGGFMCNTDRDGTNLNTKKNSWYTGRGIWVYSFLYNELAREKKHLEVARKATEFVLRNPPKGDNLWPAEYDKEGNAIAATGQFIGGKYVPVSKQVYGDLFIADGLAEYGRACGDDQYWDMAKEIVLKCVKLYDQPDYDPTAPQVYLAGDPGSEMPGARLVGVWMMLLRIGSQMLAQREDPDIDGVVRRSIDAIFRHHYNPDCNLLNEVLRHDLSRPENEYRDLVYTGHGIESLWMVMCEAHRRRDKVIFQKAARLFRRHLEVAWDDVYGGLLRGCKNIEQNTWILDKAAWVQEEALIGCLIAIEHTGADWAKHWFSKIFTYVQKTFPLKKHGYALWDHWPDRKATFVKHYERVENFHHPRHLMLNLCSLERMMKRGGAVSDFLTS